MKDDDGPKRPSTTIRTEHFALDCRAAAAE
jgi:hypothetical protein